MTAGYMKSFLLRNLRQNLSMKQSNGSRRKNSASRPGPHLLEHDIMTHLLKAMSSPWTPLRARPAPLEICLRSDPTPNLSDFLLWTNACRQCQLRTAMTASRSIFLHRQMAMALYGSRGNISLFKAHLPQTDMCIKRSRFSPPCIHGVRPCTRPSDQRPGACRANMEV